LAYILEKYFDMIGFHISSCLVTDKKIHDHMKSNSKVDSLSTISGTDKSFALP